MSSRQPRTVQRHRGVGRLGLALGTVLLVALGCSSTRQDDYRDLREYALDDSVPREERTGALLAMARNETEVTHLRATAVQMLGVLRVEEAQPTMLGLLGWDEAAPEPREEAEPAEEEGAAEEDAAAEGDDEELRVLPALEMDADARPAESELLRMEAVIALGRFAEPGMYDNVLRMVYEDRRDPSDLVVRQFLQSFAFADPADPVRASRVAEVLLRWLNLALDRNEEDSLVRTAVHELRRLTNRPDLGRNDFSAWEAELAQMRQRGRTAGESAELSEEDAAEAAESAE